jgi:hypothetical protein
MAIVKVSYTRDPIQIKEHLRYIVHRPGKDRQALTRELFDAFDRTDKARAYDLIDATTHPLFFKFILNFDAHKEDRYHDLDLRHITRKTLREMERRIGREMAYVAVMHADHTPLRHIHAIGMVQGRIAKADFQKLKTLWLTATEEARSQRRMRDRVQERQQTRFLTQARVLYQYQPSRERYLHQADTPRKRYRWDKPLRLQPGCYSCGYGQLSGLPSWYDFCPCCHKSLTQERTLQLELNRQL